MYAFYSAVESIRGFMNAGGQVLWLIAALTFAMWTLIFERFWFFRTRLRAEVSKTLAIWEGRSERQSWNAEQIRRLLVARIRQQINANLPMIQTMVALCPLLGLLGTVTGMIEVFHVMAVTGGGDPKQMAGGVSRATIPTMAGMVAALSGVFANTQVTRIASRESHLIDDSLTMDH